MTCASVPRGVWFGYEHKHHQDRRRSSPDSVLGRILCKVRRDPKGVCRGQGSIPGCVGKSQEGDHDMNMVRSLEDQAFLDEALKLAASRHRKRDHDMSTTPDDDGSHQHTIESQEQPE